MPECSYHLPFIHQAEKEKREAKKQREREKKEQLKKEGKYMTEKQKRDKARAEAMLQAMRAQGPYSIHLSFLM